jgi:hypothetical protein
MFADPILDYDYDFHHFSNYCNHRLHQHRKNGQTATICENDV